MRLLVATTNRGKLGEIGPLLEGLDVDLLTLADIPAIDPPEETGATFEENARLKARAYSIASGLLTVAEDSGLEIDALGRGPGVDSARFAGTDTPYPAKFAVLYERLRGIAPADRTARFVCALALASGQDVVFEARGTVEGLIADEPAGTGGFGYDPIFYYPPFNATLAEAANRKSHVSHRGQAFRALRSYLSAQRSVPARG
jgi:XTP/dITP diphosphohydrolase